MKQKKPFLVFSHISDAYAPTFPFLKYLKERGHDFDFILHPLVNASIRTSDCKMFESGKQTNVKSYQYNRAIKTSDYVFHFLLNVFWTIFNEKKYSLIFGFNNLNAFAGLFLKFLGKADKVIFYTVDYTEKRFENPFINKIYNILDKFCVRHCDYILSVSSRIQEVRRKQGLSDSKNLLQPNGVHVDRIRIREKSDSYPIRMIYTGHITKSKGIDLVVRALSRVEQKDKFKLDVFGNGPFMPELKKIILESGISDIVKLKGLKNNEEILEVISDYHIGIALYTQEDSFNYYCDPVKVKEYIAAKNIIFISDVPHIAEDVEKMGIGFKVKNDADEIALKLEELADMEKIKSMRANFNNVNLEVDWFALFDSNFEKINIA